MKARLTERRVDLLKARGSRYDVRDDVVPGLLVRVGSRGHKTYYLDYYDGDGKRSKYRIGSADAVTLVNARREARKRAADVAAGDNLNGVKRERRKQIVVQQQQILGVFVEQIYTKWRNAERRRADEDLARLELHFGQWYQLPMSQITEAKVLDWRQERLLKGMSPKTVNRDIACLMAVFSHALRVEIIPESPLRNFKQLKVDLRERVRFLSAVEESCLRQYLEDREASKRQGRINHNRFLRDRKIPLKPAVDEHQYYDHITPLILLAVNTGCRPEELLTLEWRDIDFVHKNLTVRGVLSKNSRTRHIPLSSEAVRAAKRWKSSPGSSRSGLVFPGAKGLPMDRMPRAITRIIAACKLDDFRPYDFRHTFASKLALAGVDLNTIRELMGHETIQMTLIYAHLTQDHRRQAIAKVFD
jgi:integrase